jgi:hypothetical protein
MVRIIDSRVSRLMLLAKETGTVIACGNPYVMEQKARAYELTGINFISYKQYLYHDYPDDKGVYIDELECFVHSLGKLNGYTLSNED